MRYFLIDRITKFDLGKEAIGIKCVSFTDNIVHDHFPKFPLFPASMIIEAMGQLGGLLLDFTINKKPSSNPCQPFVARINNVKIYNPTTPGDVLVIKAIVQTLEKFSSRIQFEINCDEDVRAVGELTYTLKEIEANIKDIEEVKMSAFDRYKLHRFMPNFSNEIWL